jgi:cell shape-determining protein MreC
VKAPSISASDWAALRTLSRAMILLESVIENAKLIERELHNENSRQRRELAHWKRMAASFNRENDELRAKLMARQAPAETLPVLTTEVMP